MKKLFIALLLIFAFSASHLYAACSGTSPNLTAASASWGDVKACVDISVYDDIITVPAGSADWNDSYVTISKYIKLVGAGEGSTTITTSRGTYNGGIVIDPDSTSISSGGVFEISGFTFDGDSADATAIVIDNSSTAGFGVVNIHDNTFQNFGSLSLYIRGYWKGVVHNNTWAASNDMHAFRYISYNATSWNWLDEYTYGTDDVIFIEDNVFNNGFTVHSGGWSSRAVVRFNQYNISANLYPMVDIHGNQGSGVCGMMGFEMYENNIAGDGHTCTVDMRGGRAIHFKNVMTNGTYSPRVRNENCNDLEGTCDRDGDTQTFNIQNSYHFLNTDDGSNRATSFSSDGCDEEVSENSEYWNQNTSYNPGVSTSLTTGVGVGTKAQMNIVTTCTEGVGFWVTDEGSWNGDGDDGQLYRCNGSNTWVLYYTPYAYPHPLRTGEPPGGDEEFAGLNWSWPNGDALSCSTNPKGVSIQGEWLEAAVTHFCLDDGGVTCDENTSFDDMLEAAVGGTTTTSGGIAFYEVRSHACGTSGTYWVRGQDAAENESDAVEISFSVNAPPDPGGPTGLSITEVKGTVKNIVVSGTTKTMDIQ